MRSHLKQLNKELTLISGALSSLGVIHEKELEGLGIKDGEWSMPASWRLHNAVLRIKDAKTQLTMLIDGLPREKKVKKDGRRKER